jgi:hypothetical protein
MGYGDVSFTMATPFVRAGYMFLRPVMWLATRNREFAPLQRISTLHFAAFGLIDSVFKNGRRTKLERHYLLFFSLFDGAADAYLADFSALVPDYIDSMWGKCMGYPGGRDLGRFMHWLGEHTMTKEKPQTEGGATRYEYHGYRVDRETSGPPVEAEQAADDEALGSAVDRRLAPMALIAKAMELRRRLINIPDKEALLRKPEEAKRVLESLAVEVL